MSNIPGFVGGFSDGDANNNAWSTRLPKGGHQFLLDLKSDWHVNSNSEILRSVVAFAANNIEEVAKLYGETLCEKTLARIELLKVRFEAQERRSSINELYATYIEAMNTDHTPTKNKLLKSAERHARANDLDWPPREMPLISYDEKARYLHTRILALLSQSGDSRISLRDLSANSVGSRDELLLMLEKLEEHEFVTLTREKRSGPVTIWISVPTLTIAL